MTEELKQRIISQIPEELNVQSDIYFEDEQRLKIRGTIGQYAIGIEWDYGENPDECILHTIDINQSIKSGTCETDKLKETLLMLI